MAGFELTTRFEGAAVDELFGFATDPALAPEVLAGVVRLEVLSEGPLRPGSRLRETRVVDGEEATADLLVIEHAPPHRHAVQAQVQGIVVTYRYTFVDEGSAVRLTWSCDVVATGLKRMLAPVVAAVMKREDGDHLELLKVAFERRERAALRGGRERDDGA